ncbi:molybdenum cofactor biosynthesis protein MoaE [Peribacillus psychrosaccharolyticus]|uniref:Molybdopterin synthase catalytic subunit n=1 Tax=Peribacillus psychrosaccharolyticus TaxID=1407 RepID=A0A974NJQ9_PERPY|nr:molybdenum cofactor biosynthesis protein MoaE [Peribacillus psychrosaccharolyticus]MEC2055315.1 molybdenum cofactor biosynthesis protein MoaE [Peribacillus psychrosaccharolyticus]MED3745305.1 molybdenum cofactor biosynthesis protein MoaE [Peribacillus psychrosaccharolyticus]QQS99010.1 molybdenum cofactor biosynthesis protein MoaE [Peribacillus psychrosaccharolyticus]
MNFELSKKPIDIQSVIDKVVSRNAGAVTTFIGTVREMTKGKKTLFLIYDAYEAMAVKKLEQIGAEISERWPDANTAITHRTGKLEITDIAVVIAVSTPHRNDAYEANRYAIERIKEIVPIWKKEHWEDGEKWIGNQLETVEYPAGKPEKEDLDD